MTINIEELNRDMEAGTPGPWFADMPWPHGETWIGVDHPQVGRVTHAEVRSGCGEADELGCMDANARRIARLPDLEQGYLDMRARVEKTEDELKTLKDEYDQFIASVQVREKVFAAGMGKLEERAEAAEAALRQAVPLMHRDAWSADYGDDTERAEALAACLACLPERNAAIKDTEDRG